MSDVWTIPEHPHDALRATGEPIDVVPHHDMSNEGFAALMLVLCNVALWFGQGQVLEMWAMFF